MEAKEGQQPDIQNPQSKRRRTEPTMATTPLPEVVAALPPEAIIKYHPSIMRKWKIQSRIQ
jgi:hypothetical protein